MEADIAGALRDLEKIVERIAQLREWQKLARQEQALNSQRHLFIPDSDQEEIDTLCGSFMLLRMTVQEALKRADLACAPDQRDAWHHRLRELEQAVAFLS